MKKFFLPITLALSLLACRREFSAPVPTLEWDLFNSSAARALPPFTRTKSEGVYTITDGSADFGTTAAAKWSYTAIGTDTTYHLSFFVEPASAYFICQGKQLDSAILLNGYWRRMTTTETGRVRLTIAKAQGGSRLLQSAAFNPITDTISINGVYGFGEGAPATPISLRYTRPLFAASPFQIIAHRGGGRTADLLPASENSVEMIRLASRFGATGVEIDVRLTKDGVPILFHDATLNLRVVQKSGLAGPVENYTFSQLNTIVRLTNGERIPTLRQALDAVLYQTPLQFVWLDTKYDGDLQAVRDLQAEYLTKAAAANRRLEIVIGLPDEKTFTNFKRLANYQTIPSLVELSPDKVQEVNARVWAPQWTLGLQNDEVFAQQSAGRRVYTWTMDVPENIVKYMREGRFNGILSNYPSIVAYYRYVR